LVLLFYAFSRQRLTRRSYQAPAFFMINLDSAAAPFFVEVISRGDALPPDAIALLRQSERRSIQCGPDWYALLAQHVFSNQSSARWLVLREGGRCTAVWPMRTGRDAGSLSNFYTALYEPAHATDVSAPGLQALARALRSQGLGVGGRYTFEPMDPQAPSFVAMESALRGAGLMSFRFFRFGNWYMPCDGVRYAPYFAERAGVMRSTVKRAGKKFKTEGGTLELVTGGDRLDAGITAYQQVYAASWKVPEPYPHFLRDQMLLCAERGWLRLAVAWLNGRAIAAQFWTVAHGKAEIVKLAYDEEFKAHAAGTLLTALLFEHVLDQDHVQEVDYLIGDDPYKNTWVSHRRERWGLVAYDPLTVSGAAGLGRETIGRLVKRWRPGKAVAAPPV
jgi:CelD/BcsL family acetyltransferase involved in cellulose biosynthesis